MDIDELKKVIEKGPAKGNLHIKDSNSKEVGHIEVNPMLHIIFSVSVYKGQKWIDIRTWILGNAGWMPTKKGIHLPADDFEKFREKLGQMQEFL